MGAPYVSVKRLVQNSMSAMLTAIEAYNKPQAVYRDEVTVILVVNAWELALKAALRQDGKAIYYRKSKGKPYRSYTLDDALNRVRINKLWPPKVEGAAAEANIKALAEYRDRAIHLYNTPGLANVLYPFLQQSVLNYRDFVLSRFRRDFAADITWQLLPLGATAPADLVEFMRVDPGPRVGAEVIDFIDDLRRLVDEVEAAGGDTSRVATTYDINLRSVKSVTSADLVVGVAGEGSAHIVERKVDPSKTHPYSMTELLSKVNEKRKGRDLTQYDHTAICWKQGLRGQARYAWRHGKVTSYFWSPEAVTYLSQLPDDVYNEARTEYGSHVRTTQIKKKRHSRRTRN